MKYAAKPPAGMSQWAVNWWRDHCNERPEVRRELTANGKNKWLKLAPVNAAIHRGQGGFSLVSLMISASLSSIVLSAMATGLLANQRLAIRSEGREMAVSQIGLVASRWRQSQPAIAMAKCSYVVTDADLETGVATVEATCSAGAKTLARTVSREVAIPVNDETNELITPETAGLVLGETITPPTTEEPT